MNILLLGILIALACALCAQFAALDEGTRGLVARNRSGRRTAQPIFRGYARHASTRNGIGRSAQGGRDAGKGRMTALIISFAIWGCYAAFVCISEWRDANKTLDQLGERELVTRECANQGRG